jgi:hypothetical protein
MSNFRFRAKLDDAVFVLVILAGFAVSAAMEIGAMLPVFEQASDSIPGSRQSNGGLCLYQSIELRIRKIAVAKASTPRRV